MNKVKSAHWTYFIFPYLNDGRRNGGTVLIDISNLDTFFVGLSTIIDATNLSSICFLG